MKKHHLIKYPLKTDNLNNIIVAYNEADDSYLVKTDKISLQFRNKKPKEKKNLYVLSIQDENVTIEGTVDKGYQMIDPMDFYLPSKEENDYNFILSSMIKSDPLSLGNLSTYLNKKSLQGQMFSQYTPQNLTSGGTYKSYTFKDFKFEKSDKQKYFTKFGEDIPNSVEESRVDEIKKKYDIETYDYILNEYKRLFVEQKISSYKQIQDILKNNEKINKIGVLKTKPFLYLVSYYVVNGPFGKKWVKLGYDPVKDINNLKFQTVTVRSHRFSLDLSKNPDVIDMLMKERNLYIDSKCSYETGFISKKGMEALSGYCKRKNITENVFEIKSEDDLEF